MAFCRERLLEDMTPHYKMGQVYDWTLSMQQQLRNNLVLEMNYSASDAHHLPVYNQDLNRFAGDLIVNNGSLERLNPNFGTLHYATSDGNSVGNYGSVMLSRPYSRGVAIRGIYTWGKALDEPTSNSASIDARIDRADHSKRPHLSRMAISRPSAAGPTMTSVSNSRLLVPGWSRIATTAR